VPRWRRHRDPYSWRHHSEHSEQTGTSICFHSIRTFAGRTHPVAPCDVRLHPLVTARRDAYAPEEAQIVNDSSTPCAIDVSGEKGLDHPDGRMLDSLCIVKQTATPTGLSNDTPNPLDRRVVSTRCITSGSDTVIETTPNSKLRVRAISLRLRQSFHPFELEPTYSHPRSCSDKRAAASSGLGARGYARLDLRAIARS
jgi:hypothetical protein